MTLAAIMDTLYACWNRQDIPGLCALFTEDCRYEDMAMRVTYSGRTQLAEFARGVFTAMPDFRLSFRSRAVDTDTAAAEWTIEATWNGEYEGIDVTGGHVRFDGISFYTFRDGKIAGNVDCWDPTVVMEQLGVRAGRLENLRRAPAASEPR